MKQHPGTFVFGLIFVVFGGGYLLDLADIVDIRPIRLWPIILVAVGLVIALSARRDDADD